MTEIRDEQNEARTYWIDTLRSIVDPVLEALQNRQLKALMPVESLGAERARYTHLEALGRTLSGLAPWLEGAGAEPAPNGPEAALRAAYAERARTAIDAGTDPASDDYMNFGDGDQPLVDAAFLAHALLRAPRELADKLDSRVRAQVVAALRQTRGIRPHFCNWLLFSAMVEAALHRLDAEWDAMRIDYALRQHEQWYKGDGVYGDGPEFHFDYYNSFVIQPMMIDILDLVADRSEDWKQMKLRHELRCARYADVQERLIGPDGTYPPIGRSLAYRFGAFQHLSQMALQHRLPAHLSPAQVRCALTAAIRRTMEAPGNFDENGWLTIGFCGHQPEIGEPYISTGSLYLCASAFAALGLPASDPFWSGAPEPWTAQKAWGGLPFAIDHALKG